MAKAVRKVKATEPKGDVETKETKATALVPMPNAKALSLDVGMKALNFMSAYADAEAQVTELEEGLRSNRYEAQKLLTFAIVKAAKNDPAINLADAFSDDKPAKNKLGKQIRLALGLYRVYQQGSKMRVDWTPEAAARMFATDDDDARTANRKESVRTNFATMLTKAMRVSLDIVENNLKVEEDKEFNTLRLTGPAIEKHFGMASVVLNEDQNARVLDKRGNVIGQKMLKARPSFTEIARHAAEAHGKKLVARKDSRTQAIDPMKHIIQVCGDLEKAIEKLPDEIPEAVSKALEGLQSAIEEAIA
jgi:hypothetical protein